MEMNMFGATLITAYIGTAGNSIEDLAAWWNDLTGLDLTVSAAAGVWQGETEKSARIEHISAPGGDALSLIRHAGREYCAVYGEDTVYITCIPLTMYRESARPEPDADADADADAGGARLAGPRSYPANVPDPSGMGPEDAALAMSTYSTEHMDSADAARAAASKNYTGSIIRMDPLTASWYYEVYRNGELKARTGPYANQASAKIDGRQQAAASLIRSNLRKHAN